MNGFKYIALDMIKSPGQGRQINSAFSNLHSKFYIHFFSAAAILLLTAVGCEPTSTSRPQPTPGDSGIYEQYQPQKALFLPLTEIKPPKQQFTTETITAFVALQDTGNSAIKAPGIFRFELYQYAPRTAEGRGKRLQLWDDINLTNFPENNNHWRDYLRAYEFELEYEFAADGKFVLEVTFISSESKRLTTEITLAKP